MAKKIADLRLTGLVSGGGMRSIVRTDEMPVACRAPSRRGFQPIDRPTASGGGAVAVGT